MEKSPGAASQPDCNVTSILKLSSSVEYAAALLAARLNHPAMYGIELSPERQAELILWVAERVGLDPGLVPLPEDITADVIQ